MRYGYGYGYAYGNGDISGRSTAFVFSEEYIQRVEADFGEVVNKPVMPDVYMAFTITVGDLLGLRYTERVTADSGTVIDEIAVTASYKSFTGL